MLSEERFCLTKISLYEPRCHSNSFVHVTANIPLPITAPNHTKREKSHSLRPCRYNSYSFQIRLRAVPLELWAGRTQQCQLQQSLTRSSQLLVPYKWQPISLPQRVRFSIQSQLPSCEMSWVPRMQHHTHPDSPAWQNAETLGEKDIWQLSLPLIFLWSLWSICSSAIVDTQATQSINMTMYILQLFSPRAGALTHAAWCPGFSYFSVFKGGRRNTAVKVQGCMRELSLEHLAFRQLTGHVLIWPWAQGASHREVSPLRDCPTLLFSWRVLGHFPVFPSLLLDLAECFDVFNLKLHLSPLSPWCLLFLGYDS